MTSIPMCYTVHIELNARNNYESYSLIAKSIDNDYSGALVYKIRVCTIDYIGTTLGKQCLDVFFGSPDGSTGVSNANSYTFEISNFTVASTEITVDRLNFRNNVVDDNELVPKYNYTEFNVATNVAINQLQMQNPYAGHQFIIVQPNIEYTLFKNKFFFISVPRLSSMYWHITFYNFTNYINISAMLGKFQELDQLGVYSVKDGGEHQDYLKCNFDLIKGYDLYNDTPLSAPSEMDLTVNGLTDFTLHAHGHHAGCYLIGYTTSTQNVTCNFKLELDT